MNLFVIGFRADGGVDGLRAAAGLRAALARLPFFAADDVRSWGAPSGRAALAWVAHTGEAVGGVRYVHKEPARVALFSGRPVLRGAGDPGEALDPRTYLRPLAALAPRLDGRWVAARYDDHARELEVAADELGAYPVYETRDTAGVRWLSNNPRVLVELAGPGEPDRLALAGVLGGGWSLEGHPVWGSVRRLGRGRGLVLRPNAERSTGPVLDDAAIARMFGAGWDPRAAAEALVGAVRDAAGWPGRPDVVPVTGGRDSRVVLAAAVRAGLSFRATTGGPPEHPDVVGGRAISARVGVAHEALAGDAHGTVLTRPWDAARIVGAATGGISTLGDAAGFPLGPRPGPLVLWHSGQGGEIARPVYASVSGGGPSRLGRGLYGRFVARRPGRPELISGTGRALVRASLDRWVRSQLDAGVAPEEVAYAFFLLVRMGTWAGPAQGCVEWVRDATSPLWSVEMLPHLLGASYEERGLELVHRRLLQELAPELVGIPFAGLPWPVRRGALGRRVARGRLLAGKAALQGRRRWAAQRARRTSGGPLARVAAALPAGRSGERGARPEVPWAPSGAATPGGAVASGRAMSADPFLAVHAGTRERVLAQPGHPAWDVLDRPRVERLLARDPVSLDLMGRYQTWRLATVFAGDLW